VGPRVYRLLPTGGLFDLLRRPAAAAPGSSVRQPAGRPYGGAAAIMEVDGGLGRDARERQAFALQVERAKYPSPE
jgi:hypothetical protein